MNENNARISGIGVGTTTRAIWCQPNWKSTQCLASLIRNYGAGPSDVSFYLLKKRPQHCLDLCTFFSNRETVCCGVIFRGPQNAVVIDTNYFRPCESRRRLLDRDQGSSAGTSSPSSSSPSASLSPASASPPTSTEINFKMDSTGDDQRSECDSETNFDDRNFTDGQNGHSKMAVPAAF